MTLWYRCEMCSPDQSRSFDITQDDPPLSSAFALVAHHHRVYYPNCPAAKDSSATEEILLVRIVQ